MPLNWKRFMDDEKILAMTAEHLGCYVRLLHRAWFSEPPASLPDSDALLAAICGMDPSRFTQLKPAVMTPFVLKRGRWHQMDLLQVIRAVKGSANRLSQAGRKGARNRWRACKH